MTIGATALRFLADDARALAVRLARVKSFALIEPMVPAAALAPDAQAAIERFLIDGRLELVGRIAAFLRLVEGERPPSPPEAQHQMVFLRLRFNAVLTQFDMFNDVITQRSEHGSGVWLAGLDVAARDALTIERQPYVVPPVICYLDRGAGAAIRRARTRLPGGGENPVAIIRVPRERMIGCGIASSLFHEAGHQAAALLDLVPVMRALLQVRIKAEPGNIAWRLFDRWISEIVADLWSIARAGVASIMGLIAVVSLPRAFVFRHNEYDPHPTPWLRVLISTAMGDALFPDPQWRGIADVWRALYPLDGLPADARRRLDAVSAEIPAFAALITTARIAKLSARTLGEALGIRERTPAALRRLYTAWDATPRSLYRAKPAIAFAVLGQARVDSRLAADAEGKLIGRLLTHWAMTSALDGAHACGAGRSPQTSRPTQQRAASPTTTQMI